MATTGATSDPSGSRPPQDLSKSDKTTTTADVSLLLPDVWNLLGEIYWRQGDLEEALLYLKRAMAVHQEHNPDSVALATTLQNMACVFAERYQDDQALVLLQHALEIKQRIDPHSMGVAHTHHNIAIVLGRTPEFHKQMLQHYLKAIKIKQAKSPLSESLARTYLTVASHCDAATNIQFAQKAQRIAQKLGPPRHTALQVDIHLCLGVGYSKEGVTQDMTKAIELVRKAKQLELKLSPQSLKFAEINTHLAKLLESNGQLEEARAARTTALHVQLQKAPTRLDISKKKVTLPRNLPSDSLATTMVQ